MTAVAGLFLDGLDLGGGTVIGSHGLRRVDFPGASGRLRAVCECGFATPTFIAAGLAESYLDDHVAREAARAVFIEGATRRMDAMALGAVAPMSRRWLEHVRDAITERLGHAIALDHVRSLFVNAVVIDDDPRILEGLQRRLTWTGCYQVVGCGSSGIDAVAVTVVEQPDLLIVDDLMPYMGGADAIKLLRRLGSSATLCLYSETDVACSPADMVVSKTVSIPDLIARLLPLTGPR